MSINSAAARNWLITKGQTFQTDMLWSADNLLIKNFGVNKKHHWKLEYRCRVVTDFAHTEEEGIKTSIQCFSQVVGFDVVPSFFDENTVLKPNTFSVHVFLSKPIQKIVFIKRSVIEQQQVSDCFNFPSCV